MIYDLLGKAKEENPKCKHEHKTFVLTREDWCDGDDDDIYRCDDCGARVVVYVPR